MMGGYHGTGGLDHSGTSGEEQWQWGKGTGDIPVSHNSCACQGITTACSLPWATKCVNHRRTEKENQNIQPCVTVFVCPYRGNCQVKSCICQHFLWNSYQSQIIQSLFRAVFPSHKDTSTLHPVWFVPMELSLAFFLDFDQGTQKLCAFPLVFNCFYSSFSWINETPDSLQCHSQFMQAEQSNFAHSWILPLSYSFLWCLCANVSGLLGHSTLSRFCGGKAGFSPVQKSWALRCLKDTQAINTATVTKSVFLAILLFQTFPLDLPHRRLVSLQRSQPGLGWKRS